MKIEHVGLWVENLELLRNFYVEHFNAVASKKYFNPQKKFSSYFLTFKSGARLELMHSPNHDISRTLNHLAFSVGSPSHVDNFYEYAQKKGISILNPPRQTGDGYYELLLEDLESNQIEVTV